MREIRALETDVHLRWFWWPVSAGRWVCGQECTCVSWVCVVQYISADLRTADRPDAGAADHQMRLGGLEDVMNGSSC